MLDLARQVVPALSRVCHLSSASSQLSQVTSGDLRRGGTALGLQIQILPVRTADELEGAFEAARGWGAQALLADTTDLFLSFGFERVPRLAALQRLPDFYFPRRGPVDSGGLMSYGPNIPNQYRRAAYFVDRILRGARPNDLPIERPSIYELVANVKTANALGLTFAPDVAAQVTEWVD